MLEFSGIRGRLRGSDVSDRGLANQIITDTVSRGIVTSESNGGSGA